MEARDLEGDRILAVEQFSPGPGEDALIITTDTARLSVKMRPPAFPGGGGELVVKVEPT